MDWFFIGGVLLFVLVLLITVAIHEAGHMTAAKILKLDVPQFSVGFGPKLFTKKTKKTAYSLRAIPLGGFVVIHDERFPDKSYERQALSRVSPWKRQIIFFAGPAVNLIVGMALLLGVLMFTPYHEQANYVGKLYPCESEVGCGALQAGLQEDDKIVEIDGMAIDSFEQLNVAKADKETLATVVVERAGKLVTINDLQLKKDEATGALYMGIQATKESYRSVGEAWTFVDSAIRKNIVALIHMPEKVPQVVDNIFTGEKKAEDPASVVVAGKTYGDLAANVTVPDEDKIFTFMYWSALFNLGIGLINLLPILPLDGGRMWIALCDSFKMRWAKLRKKEYEPVTQAMFSMMATVSAVAVFGLMALVIASDISAIAAGNL